MDIISTEFEKRVVDETRNIEKSQVVSKVNKSRKTWTNKGYQKGVAKYKITYPCSVCGEELVMTPDNMDHIAMKKIMVT
jgi:hypothetical protein